VIQPLDLIILTFATFYLSFALVHLDMPFNVMKTFRERVTTGGGLLLCFWCCAWWVALVLFLVQYRTFDLITTSAIAGAASFGYKNTGGGYS
jgi:hypothetical protein